MEGKQKTLEVLVSEVIGFLQKLSYSKSRISQYRSAWQRVAVFMKENNLTYYSAAIGEAFVYHLRGGGKFQYISEVTWAYWIACPIRDFGRLLNCLKSLKITARINCCSNRYYVWCVQESQAPSHIHKGARDAYGWQKKEPT